MNYSELVARLRDIQRLRSEGKPIPVGLVFDQCAVAADAIEALLAENDRLREELAAWTQAAMDGHPSPCTLGPLCPYCEINRLREELAAAQSGTKYLRSKLQRVRDSLKFAANSPGGLVAEIDAALKEKRDE